MPGFKCILLAEDNHQDPQLMNSVKQVGLFWAVINGPPPGNHRKTKPFIMGAASTAGP